MRCVFTTRFAPLLACLVFGCTKHLPPAETPAQTPPVLGEQPPTPAGRGRLVVDVVDGPTLVQRVRMVPEPVTGESGGETWRFSESLEPLCNPSPCVVDLPLGNHILAFPVRGSGDGLQIELVHVTPEPAVYRRALATYEGASGAYLPGILGATFGSMALVPGLVFLPLGYAEDKDGFITGGAVALAVGGGLLLFGIIGILAGRPSYRSGASVHFPLSPRNSPAHLSVRRQ